MQTEKSFANVQAWSSGFGSTFMKIMSTPKAKLHQVYANTGKRCVYETRAVVVEQAAPVVSPDGLLDFTGIKEERPTFECTLHLPDGSTFLSGSFSRKKDAEQEAARLALQQLGVVYDAGPKISTVHEKWELLSHKVQSAFADQMVLSYKPLVEHFRLAVKRKDSRHGQVPVTVLTALDTKIMSQCKSIDHLAEISAAFAAALVSMAVSASSSLQLSADGLWISRTNPFSEKVVIELLHHREDLNVQAGFYTKSKLQFKAINIPASAERAVTAIELTVDEDAYYLDVLAHELGVPDAGHVLMTRAITKAPSGARLYSPLVKMPPNILVPTRTPLDTQWIGAVGKDCMLQATCCHPEGTTKNERASFLIGHPVHGNAILACVGSSWQSEGKCDCSDITLNLYHRLMLGRSPRGAYKLSRQSALVPDLPTVYNCRTQWRGAYPRSLLTDFFQQHHLPEPRFVCTYPASDSDGGSCDLEDSKQVDSNNGSINQKDAKDHQSEAVAQGPFRYAVWVTSDGEQNSMFFESQGYHKTRYDASQSAALKVMAHYSTWCDANIPGYVGTQKPLNYLKSSEDDHCKSVECQAVKNNATMNDSVGMTSNISTSVGLSAIKEIEYQVVAEDDEVGGTPPAGSMVSVSFSIHMVKDAAGCTSSGRNDNIDNIILEEQSEFEFELGTGAVIGEFEVCVINARVGQTLSFLGPAPPVNFLLATQDKLSQPVCGDGLLKYTVKLNKYMEAPEERMESAHFSPPLSKQRNEFARNIIKALEPKFLVDLGCGSGSLLEAILEQPLGLEHIVGVDTSHKGLIRAAKALQGTLTNPKSNPGFPWPSIQKISLYEGSIADVDPHLHAPDLATCIEVVEHMDPEPLEKLGESILGSLAPQVWMVSTPNAEYNPILQGSTWDPATNSLQKKKKWLLLDDSLSGESIDAMEQDRYVKDTKPPKFRNDDHRFEWTRLEFREWACKLAAQFNYQVSFSGVGGDGHDDNGPGFASQIAIFAVYSLSVELPGIKWGNPTASSCSNLSNAEVTVVNSVQICSESKSKSVQENPYTELWRWTPSA